MPAAHHRSWRTEPLLHFTALAALLFALHAVLVGDTRETIRVDGATRSALVKRQADLLSRPLTAAEEVAAIDAFIEEEMLWREARHRGLDDNSWLRRLLVQNMRALLAGATSRTSEEELRAFFADHPEKFEQPPRWLLEHAFFAGSGAIPADIAARLAGEGGTGAVGDIDPAVGPRRFMTDRDRLTALLGTSAANAIVAIADHDWHGPIAGTRGFYFVRVIERLPPRMPSFEEARPWAETLVASQRQRRSIDQAMTQIQARYRVVVDPSPRPAPR